MPGSSTPVVSTLRRILRRIRRWKIDAGWAALLGALIGGLATYVIAYHQSDEQADQTQRQFIHTQAQAVYSRAISDGNDVLETVLGDCGSSVFGAKQIKRSPAYGQRREALLNDDNNIELIGSRAAALDVGNELRVLDNWETLCTTGENRPQLKTFSQGVLHWQNQFVVDARADIDS